MSKFPRLQKIKPIAVALCIRLLGTLRTRLVELRMKAVSRGRLARRRVVIIIRRSIHLTEDSVRDAVVDGLRRDVDALMELLKEKVEQDVKHASLTKEINTIARECMVRLEYHENGPLALSKERLDKKRNRGIIVLPGRNGH